MISQQNHISYFKLFILATLTLKNADAKPNLDLLWKARGLQARERLAEVGKKYGENISKFPEKERCLVLLEGAFSHFASESLRAETKQAIHTVKSDSESYHLIFVEPSAPKAEITVGYSRNKDTPFVIYAQSLSNDSAAGLLLNEPGTATLFHLVIGKCSFLTSLSDPLAWQVSITK